MIDASLPATIADRLDGRALDEDTLRGLRASFPGVHFTACSDDDVVDPMKPFVERPALRIYLVDGSDHCLSLTGDPELASGLLLAAVDEDED